MDKVKAREFIEELHKLSERYGVQLDSSYEEEIDYSYEEEPYVSGVRTYLVLVDEEGFEVPLDDLAIGRSICRYCQRSIDSDEDYCNSGCEEKYLHINNQRVF